MGNNRSDRLSLCGRPPISGEMAERSKACGSGPHLFGGAGSNPALINVSFFFFASQPSLLSFVSTLVTLYKFGMGHESTNAH